LKRRREERTQSENKPPNNKTKGEGVNKGKNVQARPWEETVCTEKSSGTISEQRRSGE